MSTQPRRVGGPFPGSDSRSIPRGPVIYNVYVNKRGPCLLGIVNEKTISNAWMAAVRWWPGRGWYNIVPASTDPARAQDVVRLHMVPPIVTTRIQ